MPKVVNHFSASIISTPADLMNGYKLRHKIFSEALGFEPKAESGMESDQYDIRSIHLGLSKYTAPHTAEFPIAYARMILPSKNGQSGPLPFEVVYAKDAGPLKAFARLGKAKPFEVSRICKLPSTPPTGILYLQFCTIALAQKLGLTGAVIMVQPKFAGRLQDAGLQVKQIGPKVDYHGERAGYWVPSVQRSFARRHPDLMRAANRDMERSLETILLPA